MVAVLDLDGEGRCKKSDLPPEMCAHCRNKFKGVDRTKVAEYRTKCSCGGTINPGDRIGHVQGNWVCAQCTREAGV